MGIGSFISRKKMCWDIFLVLQVFYSKVVQIILEITEGGQNQIEFTPNTIKVVLEVLSSAVFYLPRDMPVEDFYRPGTQEKKIVPSKTGNNKGYTRIRNP